MVLELVERIEVFIAVLAVGVTSALDPMLLEPNPGWEVFVALIADIVPRRHLLVLGDVEEPSLAAEAVVRHIGDGWLPKKLADCEGA